MGDGGEEGQRACPMPLRWRLGTELVRNGGEESEVAAEA